MMSKLSSRIAALAFALSGALLSASASAGIVPNPTTPDGVWDLSTEFNTSSSVWSYGTTGTSLTGPFTAFTQTNVVNQVSANSADYVYLSNANSPSWGIGQAGANGYYPNNGSVNIEANTINIVPGQAGEYAVVRFTAAFAGTYTVNSFFQGNDYLGQTNSDVYVVANGQTLFSDTINGFLTVRGGLLTVNLAQGQTLDFAVNQGVSGNYAFDSTGLYANISGIAAPVPEPSTYLMLGAGLMLLGFTAKKKQRQSAPFKM